MLNSNNIPANSPPAMVAAGAANLVSDAASSPPGRVSTAARAAKALLSDVRGSGYVMTALTIAGLGISAASLAVSMSQQQRTAAAEEHVPASAGQPLLVQPVYRVDGTAPLSPSFEVPSAVRQCTPNAILL